MAWFPITDPSRADDIRMRRRRALLLLGGIVLVPWMMVGGQDRTARGVGVTIATRLPSLDAAGALPAPADDWPHREIAASTLRLDLACADSVTVLSDPAYAGRAVVYARPGSQALRDVDAAPGTLRQPPGCDESDSLLVRTGNAVPLTVIQSGDTDIRLARFDAPVTVESDGSGTVRIDQAGPLTLRMLGSGDVSVARLDGPLGATLQGSGDLGVVGGEIPALDVTGQSSGDIDLGAARVGSAQVRLSGSGDFSAASVTGPFDGESSGSGDIVIGTVDGAPRVRVRGDGAGDITLRHGRIGVLDATRFGSGDLTIGAAIGSGRLEHRGSGDVDVPHGGSLVRIGD